MSPVRLTTTTVAMAVVGCLLRVLSPPPAVLAAACTAPQRLVDTAGPDSVVLCAAALLAWLFWAWGALGLLLTAGTAVPGAVGATARWLTRWLLPAGARRAAAVALGMGLGVAGPLAGTALADTALVAAVGADAGVVPDWPVARAAAPSDAPVPDWPAPRAEAHLVVPGDSLWRIAGEALRASGQDPSDAEIAAGVHAWWSANAAVVGPDPDLLLPGQVLHPPENR